jgi:VWFA-related protein
MACPNITYYIADLIIANQDSNALEAVTEHTVECAHVRPEIARQIALSAANEQVIIGREHTRLALSTLRRAIRALSALPGERLIVLASPGFLAHTPEGIKGTAELLELAVKNDVVINSLSVRGVILTREEEADIPTVFSRGVPSRPSFPAEWARYLRESARADGDLMKDLAEGTGGIFFHDNNDLRAGFKRLAAGPEFSYVLGFSPTGLNPDGSFHRLKVKVLHQKRATIHARRGYYAVKPEAEPR